MKINLRKGLQVAVVGVLGSALAAVAGERLEKMTGKLPGQLLLGCGNRVIVVDAEGAVIRSHKTGNVHDAWMLPSGNILVADTTVTEFAPDAKIVFQFKSKEPKGGGVYGCQRLDNGNTLAIENSLGRILEVDAKGDIVVTQQITPAKPGSHSNTRIGRKLKNGNYLVCLKDGHAVREYSPKGEIVQEIKTKNIAFAAFRTSRNTTLISSIDQVTEYDAAGQQVWEFAKNDLPGMPIQNMTGIQELPNGNLVIGCYYAYGKDGKGTGIFEITREKKLVWSCADARINKSFMAFQLLDKDGKPLVGDVR